MDKNAKLFLKHVREHLKEYGGKLVFGRGDRVNCGDGCRSIGYFSDRPLEIRVAVNSRDPISTVAHEYAHFLQWIDTPQNIMQADDRASLLVFDWLGGKEFENRDVEKAFCRVMVMERDAERRAVEIMKKFGLDINYDKYIRQANCYIYMHWIMKERRSWRYKPGSRDPMGCRSLISQMPNTFKAQPDKKIPQHIRKKLLAFFP
jgi:hypothetical protein